VLYSREIVTYKEHCAPSDSNVVHLSKAFSLKLGISHGEYFIDDQDFWFEVGGDGEGQADVHAGAVALDRRIEEVFHFRERHDLVELAGNLAAAHPQDAAVHVDVLAARQLGVKAGPHFQEAPHPAAELDPPARRLGDPREDFQKRALARAVAADDADDLARLDLEGDVLEGPELVAGEAGGRRSAGAGG
jgi:hypothetical protein